MKDFTKGSHIATGEPNEFSSLIRYLSGIDYARVAIRHFGSQKNQNDGTIEKDQFRGWLNESRTDQPLTYIPESEIPTRLRYAGLVVEKEKYKGEPRDRYKFQTLVLEWMTRAKYHRDSRPARIILQDYHLWIGFEILNTYAVLCRQGIFQWYEQGKINRQDGPHTVMIESFRMRRKPDGTYFSPTMAGIRGIWGSPSVKKQIFESVVKAALERSGAKIDLLRVRGSVFNSASDEYLFWEAVDQIGEVREIYV